MPRGDALEFAQRDDPLEQAAESQAAQLAPMFTPDADADASSQETHAPERAQSSGRAGRVLREADPDAEPTAAPSRVPEGGTAVNRPGIVNRSGNLELRLRASPTTDAPNIIGAQPFNSRVQVLKRFPGDWLFVATTNGQLGYVASSYVWTDMPEPNAELHRVEGGASGTAIGIAEQHYGQHADNWGQDLRFYVNVLAWANKKSVPSGTDGWKQVAFQENDLIWIPSQPFALSLRGVLNSGSASYEAADFVGLADIAERTAQLWDDFAQAIALAGQYIPEALGRHSLEGLKRGLHALIDMLLIAGMVMIVTTTIGAAVGALAGGAGAAPGAAAGFNVGIGVLQWLGLAFIVYWVADALMQIGGAFGAFLDTVWDANGDEAKLDQAAGELAEALGLTVGKIIEGQVLLAAAKGTGHVMGKLGKSRFGQNMGARFQEWLGQRASGKGESGQGDAGKGETSKGSTEQTKPAAEKTREKTTTSEKTQQHVHEGETVNDPQSPYHGKWNGKGIHSWEGLQARTAKDGYKILEVLEDPATGVRRVTIQRRGIDPKTGEEVTGKIKKTIYPKQLSPSEINAAGEAALRSAETGKPNTKFYDYGTEVKADGTPGNGYFNAEVETTAGALRVEGWFKETGGGKEIISHTPTFDKKWPIISPEKY
ncbi:SH3 domain-containing protein [Haliangium ochraceum]|uniref:SH3 type 3 domain protein n=1 Tax=Haliangium ochraceum (strain DSM 14365 / JCM 11303 / SMP-2) TaxID=502025 RepID=D0LPG8_HALO1|nr:SH3 domain-containing protein [Haliangium ochraceum]ACY13533.1 SH3 type 3 domain protein [Haliangium ochraceum DSM 14365]